MVWRLVLVGLLATTLTGGAQGEGPQPPPLRGTLELTSFSSAAGRLGVAVYLPPGYEEGGRYPVVYFLHGLPAAPSAYALRAPLFASWLDGLRLKAIAVVPQADRAGDSDPEYLNWGQGRDWETALAVDLPRFVDRHFRTIPAAAGRALVGISAGGYGAMLLGLDHPQEFGVIESWSGYFEPTNPAGTGPLELPTGVGVGSNLHEWAASLAASLGSPPPVISFYDGDHDWRFESDNVRFAAELTSAGVAHRFAVYPGGHEWQLWSAHAHAWLQYALVRLARATPG